MLSRKTELDKCKRHFQALSGSQVMLIFSFDKKWILYCAKHASQACFQNSNCAIYTFTLAVVVIIRIAISAVIFVSVLFVCLSKDSSNRGRLVHFYLRRYDERSRDYQSCCSDIFLTFSFFGRFLK